MCGKKPACHDLVAEPPPVYIYFRPRKNRLAIADSHDVIIDTDWMVQFNIAPSCTVSLASCTSCVYKTLPGMALQLHELIHQRSQSRTREIHRCLTWQREAETRVCDSTPCAWTSARPGRECFGTRRGARPPDACWPSWVPVVSRPAAAALGRRPRRPWVPADMCTLWSRLSSLAPPIPSLPRYM